MTKKIIKLLAILVVIFELSSVVAAYLFKDNIPNVKIFFKKDQKLSAEELRVKYPIGWFYKEFGHEPEEGVSFCKEVPDPQVICDYSKKSPWNLRVNIKKLKERQVKSILIWAGYAKDSRIRTLSGFIIDSYLKQSKISKSDAKKMSGVMDFIATKDVLLGLPIYNSDRCIFMRKIPVNFPATKAFYPEIAAKYLLADISIKDPVSFFGECIDKSRVLETRNIYNKKLISSAEELIEKSNKNYDPDLDLSPNQLAKKYPLKWLEEKNGAYAKCICKREECKKRSNDLVCKFSNAQNNPESRSKLVSAKDFSEKEIKSIFVAFANANFNDANFDPRIADLFWIFINHYYQAPDVKISDDERRVRNFVYSLKMINFYSKNSTCEILKNYIPPFLPYYDLVAVQYLKQYLLTNAREGLKSELNLCVSEERVKFVQDKMEQYLMLNFF